MPKAASRRRSRSSLERPLLSDTDGLRSEAAELSPRPDHPELHDPRDSNDYIGAYSEDIDHDENGNANDSGDDDEYAHDYEHRTRRRVSFLDMVPSRRDKVSLGLIVVSRAVMDKAAHCQETTADTLAQLLTHNCTDWPCALPPAHLGTGPDGQRARAGLVCAAPPTERAGHHGLCAGHHARAAAHAAGRDPRGAAGRPPARPPRHRAAGHDHRHELHVLEQAHPRRRAHYDVARAVRYRDLLLDVAAGRVRRRKCVEGWSGVWRWHEGQGHVQVPPVRRLIFSISARSKTRC